MKVGRFGKGRTLNYANRVRGALVAYKQRDMEAGGRGTHIRDIPSVASAEAAQRLLRPPRAAGPPPPSRSLRERPPRASACWRLFAPVCTGDGPSRSLRLDIHVHAQASVYFVIS